jgi:hypothetical protein
MHLIKLILEAIASLARQAWRLPQSVALAIQQSRQQSALNMIEAERLDRIRNPSKYLGKS